MGLVILSDETSGINLFVTGTTKIYKHVCNNSTEMTFDFNADPLNSLRTQTDATTSPMELKTLNYFRKKATS